MRKYTIFTLLLLSLGCDNDKTFNSIESGNFIKNTTFSNEQYDNSEFLNWQNNDYERIYAETENISAMVENNFNFIQIKDLSKIKWLISYSTQKFSNFDDIFLNDINALSVYYITDENRFKHILYQKSDDTFEINNDFEGFGSTLLLPNTLKSISKNINPRNIAFLSITNISLSLDGLSLLEESTIRNQNEYSALAENNIFIKTSDKNDAIFDNYSSCNPLNCDGPPEVGCKISGDPGGGLECRGDITDICFAEKANKEIKERNLSFQPLNLDIARNYRDNFLNNSTKGRLYVKYYYKINYILQGMDFIKKVSLVSEYKLATKLYSIINDIENAPDYQILINPADKSFLVKHLNKMKSLSRNSEYTSILDQLILDIINYTNKTKSEILVDFI